MERVVLEAERAQMTGIGRTKWWSLEREGLVPRRRIIAGSRVGWLLSELEEWIRTRPVGAPPAPRHALAARGVASETA